MNTIVSNKIILGFFDRYGNYEEQTVEKDKEYAITIKAKFEEINDDKLTFCGDASDFTVHKDDILHIGEE